MPLKFHFHFSECLHRTSRDWQPWAPSDGRNRATWRWWDFWAGNSQHQSFGLEANRMFNIFWRYELSLSRMYPWHLFRKIANWDKKSINSNQSLLFSGRKWNNNLDQIRRCLFLECSNNNVNYMSIIVDCDCKTVSC